MRERRQRPEKPTPPTFKAPAGDDMGKTLDALNAWGCLEMWKEADLKAISCFGPGVFRGYLPHAWTGVVLWYKPRGYYHYSTLHMIGVWALRHDEQIQVIIGRKDVAYAHPIYNAEAYFRRIQTEFRTFYQDNGCPPDEANHLYSEIYDPMRRLEMRQAVERLLKSWSDDHRQAKT